MDLNLLKTFAKTAELGSLTKASKSLNVPKSKVSRDLTKLEHHLEKDLLTRTPRGISLTPSGVKLWNRINSTLNLLENSLSEFVENGTELEGSIKISAPEDISSLLLYKYILEFNDLYPKVKIDLISVNSLLSFKEYGLDLALRAGKLTDSSLIQKVISKPKIIYVASSRYINLHGRPNSIKKINEHQYLEFNTSEGRPLNRKINAKPSFQSNSFPILYEFVKANKGISTLPEFMCRGDIQKEAIVNLFPDEPYQQGTLYLLSNPLKYMPNHIKVFKEFIYSKLKDAF